MPIDLELMMRRASIVLPLCLIGILGLNISAFGGGMSIWGVGAKAKGMGGAFRAVADDWSAAYYNPAGLFYITENQFTLNEVITHYRFDYSPNVRYGNYEVGFFQGKIYNRYEILTNPTLGGFFKLPVKGKDFVLGLSIFQPFDQNLSWRVFQPLNNDASLPGQQIEHNFDAVAFNATAAVELIENKMSIGLSGGILKADLVYGGFFLRQNPADPEASYYDILASRPNDLITEWQHSDGNGTAPNLRIGVLAKPMPKLNLGLSYALETSITLEGDSYFYFYMPDIFYYHHYGDDVFNPDSANWILSDGTARTDSGVFETEITLPAQLAGGVSYQVSDKLLVAGDLEYTFWSKFKGYAFDYKFSDTIITRNADIDSWAVADMNVPVKWKDALRGSLGLQYVWSETVLLRAGYMADQSAVEPGTLHPAFFDSGLKHSFSLGLGLAFENSRLDLSTQLIRYPEAKEGGNVFLEDPSGQVDGIADNLPGTYGGTAFESVIQFTVRF